MGKIALNVNGTSAQLCGCGSRLDHWEKVCGRKARFCSEVHCNGTAALGAYVAGRGVVSLDSVIIALRRMIPEHRKELLAVNEEALRRGAEAANKR